MAIDSQSSVWLTIAKALSALEQDSIQMLIDDIKSEQQRGKLEAIAYIRSLADNDTNQKTQEQPSINPYV